MVAAAIAIAGVPPVAAQSAASQPAAAQPPASQPAAQPAASQPPAAQPAAAQQPAQQPAAKPAATQPAAAQPPAVQPAAPPQPADPTQWRMATSWGGGPLLEMAAKPAAGLIDELTRGRVKLEVLAGGALGNPLKVSESVRTGAAQAGHSWAGYDWNVDKAVVLFGGYAGGLNGEQMLHWLYQGGGKALYRQFRLEKFGVVSMPCGALPAEIGMHSRKPVQHLADFNGLKLRTAGVWAEIAPGLGVTVVNVPGTEVYAALENGTIDAVESAQLSIDKAIGFHQITKYLILPGIHQPSTVQECSFNKAAWDSLAEADRRAIEIAAQTVTFDLYQRIGDDDLDAYQFLKQSGSTILLLDDEVKAKARELAFAWADKIADEEGPESWFKKVLDAQRAYQRKWADSRSLRVTVVDPR